MGPVTLLHMSALLCTAGRGPECRCHPLSWRTEVKEVKYSSSHVTYDTAYSHSTVCVCRYSMVIQDGMVQSLNVEPDGTGLKCSLSNVILDQI